MKTNLQKIRFTYVKLFDFQSISLSLLIGATEKNVFQILDHLGNHHKIENNTKARLS